MVSYEDWNKAIFQHYFSKSKNSIVFFCVDKNSIKYIGSHLGLNEEESLESFCRAVIEECKKEKAVDLALKKLTVKDGVPYQTSVIAFAILAASIMRDDEEFTAKNYWGRVEELVQDYSPNISVKKGWVKDKEYHPFTYMFQVFADYVTKNHFEFKFSDLFEYQDNKTDLVGLPIYQSMISMKDKWLLTKHFSKYNKCVFQILEEDNKFSVAFKKIIRNKKENATSKRDKLCARITDFYKEWQENGFEYDEYNRLTKARLKLGYKEIGRGDYRFYYFLKDDGALYNLEGFEQVSIKEEKYYCRLIEDESKLEIKNYTLSLDNKNIAATDKSRKFIIFKNVGENYFIETKNVVEEDSFSILLNKRDNSKIIEDYEEGYFIEDEYEYFETEINPKGLVLLHGVKAIKYNNDYILIQRKNKYWFEKGLKSDYGSNEYVQGAEPLFIFEDFDYVKVYCDDELLGKIKKSPFDIGQFYNEIEKKYSISFEKSTIKISYKINQLKESLFEPKNFKHIYHNFSSGEIIKGFEHRPNNSICTGVAFCNFEDGTIETQTSSEEKEYIKIKYILHLIKMHENSEDYPMPNNIKLWAKNCKSDNLVINDMVEYINNNNYIDNYVNIYLRNAGKVLGWEKILHQ